LRGDDDAWLYPDTDEPPVDEELGIAVEEVVEASGRDFAIVLAVAERLKEPWHLPAVREAMGCLIPPGLHRRLDGVKPKGKAQAGAVCASPVLVAGGWQCRVDDERMVVMEGVALTKGILEFFLVVLRRVCERLRLPLAIGTHYLGQEVAAAKNGAALRLAVSSTLSWKERGGMAERCAEAEEFWLPINVNQGKKVGDCVLVCVKAKGEGERIGERACTTGCIGQLGRESWRGSWTCCWAALRA
jgi:hypothetical protein